jgi:hypothetical protein
MACVRYRELKRDRRESDANVQVYTVGGPEFSYWLAQSIEVRKMIEKHKMDCNACKNG